MPWGAFVVTVGGLIALGIVIWFAVWLLKWPPDKKRWWNAVNVTAPGGAGVSIQGADSLPELVAEVIATPHPMPPVFLYGTDLTAFAARNTPPSVAVDRLLEIFAASTRWLMATRGAPEAAAVPEIPELFELARRRGMIVDQAIYMHSEPGHAFPLRQVLYRLTDDFQSRLGAAYSAHDGAHVQMVFATAAELQVAWDYLRENMKTAA